MTQTANYELETIHRIINSSRMLNVSFNDPDSQFPAVLPMIGQMGSFERPSADVGDVLDLYLHGFVAPLSTPATPSLTPSLPIEPPTNLTTTLIPSIPPHN